MNSKNPFDENRHVMISDTLVFDTVTGGYIEKLTIPQLEYFLLESENVTPEEEKEFLNKHLQVCNACGGNMLLTGIERMFPIFYWQLPDIDYSFETVYKLVLGLYKVLNTIG